MDNMNVETRQKETGINPNIRSWKEKERER